MNASNAPAGPPPTQPARRSSWATIIGALVFAGLVAGGLFALMNRASSSPTAATADASSGQGLYEANCRDCHGERALGDGPMAASLPAKPANLMEHLAHHTQAQLAQLIVGGVPPAMPPAALTDEQVQLVVDYLWTLVPADQVDAMREMQMHVEMGHMPGMSMPGMTMPGDSGQAAPMQH